MDLKDIKAMIDLMKKNAISEFELEKPDFKIKLKRGANGGQSSASFDEVQTPNYPPTTYGGSVSPGTAPTSALTSVPEGEIKSPMIGTLYRAPSPESGNYVEVGTEVNPDTVVCIIEAMKVMNEIKAEVNGVVTQVVAENSKPVEFGQPLFKIRLL